MVNPLALYMSELALETPMNSQDMHFVLSVDEVTGLRPERVEELQLTTNEFHVTSNHIVTATYSHLPRNREHIGVQIVLYRRESRSMSSQAGIW